MTFTYTPATPTDITRVRFHIADTVEAVADFSDEEIQFIIDETGGYKAAVISCIRSLMAKLAKDVDFKADWLQVDSSRSVAGLEKLLNEKLNEFGISRVRANVVHRYRPDSRQHEAPDYSPPYYDALDDDDTLY